MRCVLALVAALSIAVPTSAGITIATYTGHLIGGSYDLSGVFGPSYSALAGLAYTASFRIDDGLAGAPVQFQGSPATTSMIFGGIGYSPTAVPVNATITINGITARIAGIGAGYVIQTHGPYDQTLHHVVENGSYLTEDATLFHPRGFLASYDFRMPLDVDLTSFGPGGNDGGGFSLYRAGATGFQTAYGGLQADHLTVTLGAAVPELAAWSLMVAGFGLTGAALRRRPATAAA